MLFPDIIFVCFFFLKYYVISYKRKKRASYKIKAHKKKKYIYSSLWLPLLNIPYHIFSKWKGKPLISKVFNQTIFLISEYSTDFRRQWKIHVLVELRSDQKMAQDKSQTSKTIKKTLFFETHYLKKIEKLKSYEKWNTMLLFETLRIYRGYTSIILWCKCNYVFINEA